MTGLIRHICIWWELRTAGRKLYRALPVLRELDRREAEYRRSHKRGSAVIAKARREAICAALKGPRVKAVGRHVAVKTEGR